LFALVDDLAERAFRNMSIEALTWLMDNYSEDIDILYKIPHTDEMILHHAVAVGAIAVVKQLITMGHPVNVFTKVS
jgi:hypothetical protein